MGSAKRAPIPGQEEERKVPDPMEKSDNEAGRQRVPTSLYLIQKIAASAKLLRQRPDDESERHHARKAGRIRHEH